MRKIKMISAALVCMALMIAGAPAAFSQETPVPAETGQASGAVPAPVQESVPQEQQAAAPGQAAAAPDAVPGQDAVIEMQSLLFTYWEQTAIQDARRSRGLVRPPTEEELTKDLRTKAEDLKIKPPADQRDISLGGIVYVSPEYWTIWLNGERVTPQALPDEVMDLKVYENYVEFKWFDYYTNQIFPIRMRAHQRFNMDARIFLPG